MEPSPKAPASSRWAIWACITGLANAIPLVAYPNLICGCHFHEEAAVVALLPLAWGLYPYLCYRNLRERIVGYAGMALAIPWFWQAWQMGSRLPQWI